MEDTETLLQSLEKAAALIGLHCNENKTEYINTGENYRYLKSLSGVNLKRVEDFKYLGSWIMDSEKDFKSRKALAWVAILLYGSETWTLTQTNQKRLDGTYTNLLRRVQNIHWNEHPTKEIIYGDLPPISNALRRRRLLFAGHCLRAEDEIISSLLVLWKNRSRRTTYPKNFF